MAMPLLCSTTFYADVTNNTIDLTGSTGSTVFGVRQQNCYTAVSGGAVNFSNNTFTLGQNTSAFFINNNYGTANQLVVANNTINAAPGVVPDVNQRPRAITMWSTQQTAQVSFQNNILGSSGGRFGRGYYLWNNPSNLVSITGGSVANALIGISLHTDIGFGGAAASTVAVSGTSISADSIGIRLFSAGGNAAGNQVLQLTNVPVTVGAAGTDILINDSNADGFTMGVEFLGGNTITNGLTGLHLEGVGAVVTGGNLNNTAFSGQTGNYMELVSDPNDVTATSATFAGQSGATASLPQNFAIEDKIVHKIDDGALGFVLVKANQDFVTVNSFIAPATTAPSIQRGVNAASNGFTVNVNSGTYNEQVLVNKSVTVLGTTPKPVVNFTGTVSGRPTLFDVTKPNVTIENFQFAPDLSKVGGAIIASDAGGVSNLTIKNNDINPYTTGALLGFSLRNAVNINYGAYRNNGSNPIILAQGNIITYNDNGTPANTTDDIGFRGGFVTDEGGGTFTLNTIQTISQDIEARFGGAGDINITNNNISGGGVNLVEYNAGAGLINVTGNIFNGTAGSTYTSSLRLKNNYNAKTTTVSGNIFTGHNWGISLENYQAVTISNNTFTPAAGSTTYRHITVNTKEISSSSGTFQPNVSATITSDTFYGSGAAGGVGLAFYNHDNDAPVFGPFVIGSLGSENTFASGIGTFIRLDNSSGPSASGGVGAAGFPEYGGNTAVTMMACWDVDINIEHNTFDVGAGPQLPAAMTGPQRATLETKLYHMPDNMCMGELIYFRPVTVHAKLILQGAYDASTPLPHQMRDDLRQITTGPLFPDTDPYAQYNTAPYNFAFKPVNVFRGDTIKPGVLAVTGPNAIVDWVFLELRNKLDYTDVLATRSALVQRDGDIVDMDGTSSVLFSNSYADQYYLMVRHRNHLGAMTATPIDLTNDATFTDFSSPLMATFGTTSTSARRLLEPGVYGLWAGNLNLKKNGTNFQVIYSGLGNDPAEIITRVGATTPLNVVSGYYIEDANLNGSVKDRGLNNDRAIILNNVGATTPNNVITQQPPN